MGVLMAEIPGKFKVWKASIIQSASAVKSSRSGLEELPRMSQALFGSSAKKRAC